MRVRAGIVVVLGVAALAGTAGDALAQAPGTYAGGLLPTAGVPPPGYRPSLLIALQPRAGGRIAVRFDTTIRCGALTLDLDGRRVAPFDGTTIRTSEALVQRFDPGQRLVYRWQLTGTVAGPQASGTLHLTGEYRGPGRRVRRCTRAPDRAWQARLADAPTGGPGAPLAGSTLVGATGQRLADRLPRSGVGRVTADGRRVSALWNAVAPCGRGPRELFANFTPPRPVQGSAVSSDERFTIRFTNEVLRYHATFTAAFTTDGATGTLRLRVSV